MKLLENTSLEALSGALTMEIGDCKVSARVESYSCKMAGDDKRLFKSFSNEANPKDLTTLSPPQTLLSVSPVSPFGQSMSSTDESESPLNYVCSRKTLYYLVSTLNASFRPDYDFSNAKSDEFSKEPSVNYVTDFINNSLRAVLGDSFNRLESSLWSIIDKEILLQDCNIYSYNPDLDSDPYGDEGCLWSFNFFFYNHKLKRILFFTCQAQNLSIEENIYLYDDDDDDVVDESIEFNHSFLSTAA